jgi:uncharacterized protein YdaU (DUF1376 family)
MANKDASFFPLFGRDFLAATMGWTAEERGHYIVLLITQWEQGGLPDDLKRLERASPGVSECWETLEPKFPVCDDGERRNLRLEEHRARVFAIRDRRREAGRAGNDARWGRKGVANESQMGSQNDRIQTQTQTQTQKKSNSPSSPTSPSSSKSSGAEGGGYRQKDFIFPCIKGEWSPSAGMVKEWQSSFPSLDVIAELRKARQWCIDNPPKRKTAKGMRRFVGAWLGNAKAPQGKSTKVLASL